MSTNTAEILTRGMQCLAEGMGEIDAELFLSAVLRERFDYTKWQRTYFENTNLKDFNNEAADSTRSNPWK